MQLISARLNREVSASKVFLEEGRRGKHKKLFRERRPILASLISDPHWKGCLKKSLHFGYQDTVEVISIFEEAIKTSSSPLALIILSFDSDKSASRRNHIQGQGRIPLCVSVNLPRTVTSHIIDLIPTIDDTIELHRGVVDGTHQCSEISRILRIPWLEVDVVRRIKVVLVTDIADALGIVDTRDDYNCAVTCESEQISRANVASLAEPEVASRSSVVAVE